jgi:hypothetical protein
MFTGNSRTDKKTIATRFTNLLRSRKRSLAATSPVPPPTTESKPLGSQATGALPEPELSNSEPGPINGQGTEPFNGIQSKLDANSSTDSDTVNASNRYEEAKQKLRHSLKFRRDEWGSFEFTEVDAIPECEESSKLQNEISKLLTSRKNSIASSTTWSKSKAVVERIFRALSPFAKNVLYIAKSSQVVSLDCYC